MAFDFFSEQEKEDDLAKGSSPEQQPGGQELSGESSVVRGNEPAQAPGQGQGQGSGTFTNLQSYLDVNADRKFGQEVAGRAQGAVDQAGQAQDQANTGFRSKVDQNSVNKNDALLSEADKNPTGVVSDKAKYDEFTRMRDAQYGGPKNLSEDAENFSSANRATDRAREVGELSKSEDGRKAYLDQEYGSGVGRYDYTPGMKKLDNLLIQNDQGSRDAFKGMQGNAVAAQDRFGKLKETLDQYAGQRAASTADARTATRGFLGVDDTGTVNRDKGAIAGTLKDAQSRTDDLNRQRDQTLGSYKNALAGKDNATLQKLGLQSGQQLYGLDPTSKEFLYDQGAATINNGASKDQQARMQALTKLAGVDNTFLADANAAGTYDPQAAVKFQGQLLNDQAKARAAAYSDKVNTKNHVFNNGGFDPDTGATSGHQMESLLEALSRTGSQAEKYSKIPGGDTFAASQYGKLLEELKATQEAAGYDNTIGGSPAAGSWRNYKTY